MSVKEYTEVDDDKSNGNNDDNNNNDGSCDQKHSRDERSQAGAVWASGES